MPSKLLKTQKPESDLTATVPGPKPGDFPLRTAESRAAARAKLQALAKKEGPQAADVLFQLEESGWPGRHRKILEILDGRRRSQAPPERLASTPIIWLALPEGFSPESLSACRNPVAVRDAVRKGELPVLPISLTDLPFIQGDLTDKELARLCGRPRTKDVAAIG